MCVVSNIGGYAQDMWPKPWTPAPTPYVPYVPQPYVPFGPYEWDKPKPVKPYTGPTKEQFEELLELLRAGKKFDQATNQPDCEVEDKKKFIRELAEHLGVAMPKDLL